jgi:hypothetical protein
MKNAKEIELHRWRREIHADVLAQRRLAEDRQANAERQFAFIRLGIAEIAIVIGKFLPQPGVMRRRLGLDASAQRLFDLLQHDDVRIMGSDFLHRPLQPDGRVVRVSVIPGLPKLHIELQDFESTTHAR